MVRATARARRCRRRLARLLLRARRRSRRSRDRAAAEQSTALGPGRMSMNTTYSMPELCRLQGFGCRHLDSPFYGDLLDRIADDFEAGGPVSALLGPHASEPAGAAYPIRLLGGVHRLVLAGGAPELEP